MSKIWIYQANRILNGNEVTLLENDLSTFVSNWSAHGSALSAKGYIIYNLFLIFEVDEEVVNVTGCSVDKSVHFVKELGERYHIDFFDRMCVAYVDDHEELQLANRSEFEALVKNGEVTSETKVFNNLITSSEELGNKWKVAFKDSWHAKIFS